MAFNALIDAIGGAIPVIGDLFDFGWKATEWNMALLERHAAPGRPATSADYLVVIVCTLVVIVAALLPIIVAWAVIDWLRRPII
jgi:hypothetical protein